MKFYLSSYKLGNKTEELKVLTPKGDIGYIPNALDFSGADFARKKATIEKDMVALRQLGLRVELIDLRTYFNSQNKLKDEVNKLGAIFISGGNVFVLRQAMKLSGLDNILIELKDNNDFLYAGYSAAGCVLSPSLKAYEVVDDATDTPYKELKEVIWEGLGLINFAFMPHRDSDHPESADVEREIGYCKENNIPFQAVRDGDVLIIQ